MHKFNSKVFAFATALTVALGGWITPSFAASDSVKVAESVIPPPLDTLSKSAIALPRDTVSKTTDTNVAPTSTPVLLPTPAALQVGTTTDSVGSDTAKTVAPKKRKRIVRETTVNSIDEIKGQYRSPKKALFMSLLVPGLGQAYVGQNWVNYSRAAFYFMTDVALAYGWRHYVVTKQERQIAKYKKFADANWKQSQYENFLNANLGPVTNRGRFEFVNAHRKSYCDAVQSQDSQTDKVLNSGCADPFDQVKYITFKNIYNDEKWSVDSTSLRRSQFVDPHAFYELLGKQVEFISGWEDAQSENGVSVALRDSTFYLKDKDGNEIKVNGRLAPATTAMQQQYIRMRDKANEYARMQAFFLGGIIVNHLVSALDAAITAHYHNKSLYQTEVRWWNNIHLDGGLAWQGVIPAPTVTASLTF